MGFFNKYRKLVSIVDGECKPLSQMNDEVFSSGMLGKGFMVEPKSNYFYAPCDGKIENIAETKHAYSILTDDGIDILIHIGIDTVSLKGEKFESQVVEGQKIKSGDLIAISDIEEIKKLGYETSTAVIVTTTEKIEKIDFNYGTVLGSTDVCMSFKLGDRI
ncbi:MAG: PTS glucose transporter subunit IIA [Clostridia bacterium]|nr:PTS glucose transporter subunit IIA [Clostridia bacterium]